MKHLILFSFAMLFLSLSSCQDEEESNTQDPNSLTKTTHLSVLASRVSQSPTHIDNIIDGTSCYSIQLPVSLTVDSQYLTVASKEDYASVKTVINQYSNDDDIIHFEFPITVKYPNYQQVTINNETELTALRQACGSEPEFYEITCTRFNYPLTINCYESNSQVSYAVTVANNSQFYNFISGLKDSEIYSFKFPLSMTDSSGETIVYNSNVSLQSGIENAIDDCDEGGTGNLMLSDVVTVGSWYVSSYIDESQNETYHFTGYNFTFSSNETVVAVKSGIPTNGTWSTFMNNGNQILKFNYEGSSLHDLNRDWTVIEFNATTIRLRYQGDGGGSGNDDIHYLNITRN